MNMLRLLSLALPLIMTACAPKAHRTASPNSWGDFYTDAATGGIAGTWKSGEVRGGLQIAVAGLGLHLVGDQDVVAAGDEIVFPQTQVCVACALIHGVRLLAASIWGMFGLYADTDPAGMP